MSGETKKIFAPQESDFFLNCFDDDFDKHIEKINEYYKYLETNTFIELDWKCLGRRSVNQQNDNSKTPAFETPPKESQLAKNEFDFMDDLKAGHSKFGSRTPKTLSKKKTTFGSVMEKLNNKTKTVTPK